MVSQESGAASTARRVWRLLEPIHTVTYFRSEALTAFQEAGLRGFWRGYFAGRSAPLGAVPAAPVLACFFSFAPAMVNRALPAVWDLITPENALAARTVGAVAALRRIDGEIGAPDAAALAEANELLERALSGLEHAGRVLGAANAAVPRPDDPYAQLWRSATIIREHRGDGHIAALVSAGLGPCETIAWRCANDLDRAVLQASRGWTDEEWTAALQALVTRGWLDDSGQPTAVGIEGFRDIEERTDLTAAPAWTDVDVDRLAELLTPLSLACAANLPNLNPIGLRPPATS
jgi:helix-turn-helix protein